MDIFEEMFGHLFDLDGDGKLGVFEKSYMYDELFGVDSEKVFWGDKDSGDDDYDDDDDLFKDPFDDDLFKDPLDDDIFGGF